MNGYDSTFVHFFVWVIHILWQQQKVAQFLWLQTYPMFLEQYTESQIGMESKKCLRRSNRSPGLKKKATNTWSRKVQPVSNSLDGIVHHGRQNSSWWLPFVRIWDERWWTCNVQSGNVVKPEPL